MDTRVHIIYLTTSKSLSVGMGKPPQVTSLALHDVMAVTGIPFLTGKTPPIVTSRLFYDVIIMSIFLYNIICTGKPPKVTSLALDDVMAVTGIPFLTGKTPPRVTSRLFYDVIICQSSSKFLFLPQFSLDSIFRTLHILVNKGTFSTPFLRLHILCEPGYTV